CFSSAPLQGSMDVVSGTHGTRSQVDRLRQHRFDLPHSLLAFCADIEDGNNRATDRKHDFQNQEWKELQAIRDEITSGKEHKAEEDDVSRAIRQPGLINR